MNAVSYALFGYGKKEPKDCFEFNTYMRGIMCNVRFNRVLLPGWINVINVDNSTYNSPYKPIFDWLVRNGLATLLFFQDDEPLCLAMLTRMKTVFAYKHPGWIYEHVLCRDADSICTYREAQAVQQWIDEDKAAHCITDSISHTIPMMGGMIGFVPAYLSARLGVNSWEEMIELGHHIDYKRKGADQDFLNRFIYPKVAESVTEHFVLGMPHNLKEGNGRHYSIPDIKIKVDEKFKVTNDCAGHVGASGYYEPPTLKFLNHIDPHRDEYEPIEKQFPRLFFWRG